MKKITIYLVFILLSACSVSNDKPTTDDDNNGGATDYNQLWKEKVANQITGVSSFDNDANLSYSTETYIFDSSTEEGRGIYKKDSLFYGVLAGEDFATTLSMTKTGVSDFVDINWTEAKNITVSTPLELEPDYNQLWKDLVTDKTVNDGTFSDTKFRYKNLYDLTFEESTSLNKAYYTESRKHFGISANQDFTEVKLFGPFDTKNEVDFLTKEDNLTKQEFRDILEKEYLSISFELPDGTALKSKFGNMVDLTGKLVYEYISHPNSNPLQAIYKNTSGQHVGFEIQGAKTVRLYQENKNTPWNNVNDVSFDNQHRVLIWETYIAPLILGETPKNLQIKSFNNIFYVQDSKTIYEIRNNRWETIGSSEIFNDPHEVILEIDDISGDLYVAIEDKSDKVIALKHNTGIFWSKIQSDARSQYLKDFKIYDQDLYILTENKRDPSGTVYKKSKGELSITDLAYLSADPPYPGQSVECMKVGKLLVYGTDHFYATYSYSVLSGYESPAFKNYDSVEWSTQWDLTQEAVPTYTVYQEEIYAVHNIEESYQVKVVKYDKLGNETIITTIPYESNQFVDNIRIEVVDKATIYVAHNYAIFKIINGKSTQIKKDFSYFLFDMHISEDGSLFFLYSNTNPEEMLNIKVYR